MSVIHASMDEFVAELERDAGDNEIANKILRMESRVVGWSNGGIIPTVATCVGYRARGEVVELQAVAGDLWSRSLRERNGDWDEKDRPVRELLASTELAIRNLADQHGLDLRAGRFG